MASEEVATGGADAEDQFNRRYGFVNDRNARIEERRSARKARVVARRSGIDAATAAYAELDRGLSWVRIRRGFVVTERALPVGFDEMDDKARRKAELASRPPLTRLIHRHGEALTTFLSFVFAAHLEFAPGATLTNTRHVSLQARGGRHSWSTLAGMTMARKPGETFAQAQRKRQRHMATRLSALAAEDLQLITTVGGRFDKFGLNKETGDGNRYEVPSIDLSLKEALRIPAWFFRQGWHLALEPAELALFLAVVDMNGRLNTQALGPHLRETTYRLSDEIYENARNLSRYGLIRMDDPIGRARHNGKVDLSKLGDEPVILPYRLIYELEETSPLAVRNAFEVVFADLEKNPIPAEYTITRANRLWSL